MYGNEQMVIVTLHLHTSIAQFGSILSWICILASSMPIRQHRWFTVNFTMLKEQEPFFHLTPLSAANISILQSGRFSSPIRKIFYITYNLMDKKFPESGRLSNLCTQIGYFPWKSGSLLQNQEGLAALLNFMKKLTFSNCTFLVRNNHLLISAYW